MMYFLTPFHPSLLSFQRFRQDERKQLQRGTTLRFHLYRTDSKNFCSGESVK